MTSLDAMRADDAVLAALRGLDRAAQACADAGLRAPAFIERTRSDLRFELQRDMWNVWWRDLPLQVPASAIALFPSALPLWIARNYGIDESVAKAFIAHVCASPSTHGDLLVACFHSGCRRATRLPFRTPTEFAAVNDKYAHAPWICPLHWKDAWAQHGKLSADSVWLLFNVLRHPGASRATLVADDKLLTFLVSIGLIESRAVEGFANRNAIGHFITPSGKDAIRAAAIKVAA